MSDKPVILETKVIACTKVFQIEQVNLRFSNGEERDFERLQGKKHEIVMIVPLLDEETFLLIREYGVGLEDYYLGFPKGAVCLDEDPITAANRELMEETGYGAKHFHLIKNFSSAPAYTTRFMKVFMATDLFKHRLLGDEPEAIEVISWKFNEIDLLIQREDFHEARSIAALYMVRDLLQDPTRKWEQ